MAIELKMNTNVFTGRDLILADEVNPIVDLDNIRYLVDVETYLEWGALVWTRFYIDSQLPVDDHSFTRHYAAHNMFHELLLGSNWNTLLLQTEDFPSFPVPLDYGTVTP